MPHRRAIRAGLSARAAHSRIHGCGRHAGRRADVLDAVLADTLAEARGADGAGHW